MSRITPGQHKARAARIAKARQRFHIVRDASDDNRTKREAAALAGMSIAGVNSMLHREIGSERWPLP